MIGLRRRSARAGALNHVRRGEGEPLLLLHSLGGTHAQWTPVLDGLAENREVIAVDMPGFGASAPLPAGIEPTAANLAAAVLDFYDSLGLREPGIAGISLGAWTAIECARQNGAVAVVAISPAGFWKEPLAPTRSSAHLAARVLGPLTPVLMRSGRIRRSALAGNIHRPERVSAREATALVRGYGRAGAYVEANRHMRAGIVGDISAVKVPVTIAWTEFDRLVRNRPLNEGILPKRVRQVVLPECGHLPTWDAPELVTELILEGTSRRR